MSISIVSRMSPLFIPSTFTNALLCADLRAIFHGMKREIYLGNGPLLVNSSNGVLELIGARSILRRA